MAAKLSGCIVPFDAGGNDWEIYAVCLEQYLDAKPIREEKKVATLLTLIGGPTASSSETWSHQPTRK